MVEPGHPFEGGELQGFDRFPGRPAVNQFRLVQAVGGLGEGVVVAIALAAHRRLDASFRQSLGVPDVQAPPEQVRTQGSISAAC